MLAEAEVICQATIAIKCLRIPPTPPGIDSSFIDVSRPDAVSHATVELCRLETAFTCSTSAASTKQTVRSYYPRIRSGSHTDIGPRNSNEDEHIRIDDLATHMGSLYTWSEPGSFYAIFDGHGGPGAAAYMKKNAAKLFFDDPKLPRKSDNDEIFLQDLKIFHSRYFLLADEALGDECNIVDSYCGTTALTALVLGKHLLIANAGDCRAVLSRKGIAIQLSRDHRASCQLEEKRVTGLGGTIEYGYLNGELAVTRALGDWYMKLPLGSTSPLTAEPELQCVLLNEEDEFLIIACDGVWDVISNQEAVSLVRCELSCYNDPQRCAKVLVSCALMRDTCDNVTAIVVCFTSEIKESLLSKRRASLRLCMSEEACNKLRNLLEEC